MCPHPEEGLRPVSKDEVAPLLQAGRERTNGKKRGAPGGAPVGLSREYPFQPKMSAVMPSYQPKASSAVVARWAASSPALLMKPSVLAIFSLVAL